MASSYRPLRIAFALVFFIGLTTAGLTLLTSRKIGKRSNRPFTSDPGVTGESDEGGFFYKSLGQSPESALDSDESDVIKVANISGYTVEFSAPTHQRDAEQLVDTLKTKGITAYYTPLSDNGRIVFRVRKGLSADEGQAKLEAKSLAKVLGKEPSVVRLE